MNSETRLLKTAYILETAYFALIYCCISLPITLIFMADKGFIPLLWAVGVIVPVTAIRLICDRIAKKSRRFLASTAIVALSLIICQSAISRIAYLLCGVIAVVICCFVNRPDGKPLLTVPKFYHAPLVPVVYAFGAIVNDDRLKISAYVVALLFAIIYILHRNTTRLLSALRENRGESRVSAEGILRQNRRMIAVFLILLAVGLLLIPLIISNLPDYSGAESIIEPHYSTPIEETSDEPISGIDGETLLPQGEPINFKPFESALLALFIFSIVGALVMVAYAIISALRNVGNDKAKHAEPNENTLVIESLSPESEPKKRESPKADSWQKRIRKKYAKTIKSSGGEISNAMTPTELESAVSLPPTENTAQLHDIYEQARYSAHDMGKDDYKKIKNFSKRS